MARKEKAAGRATARAVAVVGEAAAREEADQGFRVQG